MIISIIFNVILLILLIISLILLRKFVQYSILFEDNTNESLKQLDNCYDNIEKLLDRPLLVDTPEVKFILNELRKSQNVIVDAADRITKESNDE